MFVSALLTSAVFSLMGYTLLFPFLRQSGAVKTNFRGVRVTNSAGLLVPVVYLLSLAFMSLRSFARGGGVTGLGSLLLLFLLAVSFAGFIDDLLGTRLIGGLRGHLGQLRHGIMTSGALKAIMGLAISIVVAANISRTLPLLLLDVALLTLSINTFNLFDLRPGRAVKIFGLAGLALFAATPMAGVWSLWALILPPVAVLLWTDLREEAMIGDAGSNALGAILGFTFVINLYWISKLVVLAVLIGLHLYTERYSLSDLFARAAVLRRFDELGLRRHW